MPLMMLAVGRRPVGVDGPLVNVPLVAVGPLTRDDDDETDELDGSEDVDVELLLLLLLLGE